MCPHHPVKCIGRFFKVAKMDTYQGADHTDYTCFPKPPSLDDVDGCDKDSWALEEPLLSPIVLVPVPLPRRSNELDANKLLRRLYPTISAHMDASTCH